MPPVLLSTLLSTTEEKCRNYRKEINEKLAFVAYNEFSGIQTLPDKETLLNATKENPTTWNPIEMYHRSQEQSFQEQKIALTTCIKAIDTYCQTTSTPVYVKNVGIRGFPGAGKTFCMMYTLVYAMSRGLNTVTTAIMCKRALQLGGVHLHQLFLLPTDEKITPQQRAELAIIKLMKNPKKLEFIKSLDVLYYDELGQTASEIVASLDIIFRTIKQSNIYMGGVLIMFTLDHMQIRPIHRRQFLTSSNVISCYTMVSLQHSVRASQDLNF